MNPAFHTAIYIGTGSKEAISFVVTQVSAKHYVFVVPGSQAGEPHQAQQIKNRAQGTTTVIEQPVSAQGHEYCYYRYNLDMFSGFGKANGLLELFPNITLKSTETVSTESINAVLNGLVNKEILTKQQPNYLLIDQPNSCNHPCSTLQLAAAINSKNLAFFGRVELRTANDGLFADIDVADKKAAQQNPQSVVARTLEATHFVKKAPQVALSDPELSVQAYSLDEAKQNHATLEPELERLRQANKTLQKNIRKIEEEHKVQENTNAQAGEKYSKLVAELEVLQTDKRTLEKTIIDLKQDNARLAKQLDDKSFIADELKLSFDANRKKLKQKAAENQKVIAENALLRKEIEILSKLKGNNTSNARSQKILNQLKINELISGGKTPTIVIAGMRHSGSTALFNIVRLALLMEGYKVFSGYSEAEKLDEIPCGDVDVVLLKTHEKRDDIQKMSDILISTKRDLRDTVASAARREFPLCMKLGIREYAKYNRTLHEIWQPRSDFEFHYESFMKKPDIIVEQLIKFLGLDVGNVHEVILRVNNLPTNQYKRTLLSPKHITDKDRKLSYKDNIKSEDLDLINMQHRNWLIANGYKVE